MHLFSCPSCAALAIPWLSRRGSPEHFTFREEWFHQVIERWHTHRKRAACSELYVHAGELGRRTRRIPVGVSDEDGRMEMPSTASWQALGRPNAVLL